MFADAIEKVGGFTRPVKIISRKYKEESVLPGLATLFFVNDEGWAITCKHVADEIIRADQLNKKYAKFREERSKAAVGANASAAVKKLELLSGFKDGQTAQIKVQFAGSVSDIREFDINRHPEYDLALIHFKQYGKLLYTGHAVFAKNGKAVRPGDFLCRLGFPFPEFKDFRYDTAKDDIVWDSSAGSGNTPRFPIEGMFTRHLADKNGRVYGLELSTPGLRGQS